MSATVKEFIDKGKTYIGMAEHTAKFTKFIDGYNSIRPLPRGWKLSYDDAWCAAFLSEVAREVGALDIIPAECSCYQMALQFQSWGVWYRCNAINGILPGDIVFYHWRKNTAYDHVGIITSVTRSKTGKFVSAEVLEGNKSDKVGIRVITTNDLSNIHGYARPKWAGKLSITTPTKDRKTINKTDHAAARLKLLDETLSGKHGVGEARKKSLGAEYEVIQKIINLLYS